MDKNFIENCKLLKRHFTKLTQTDTTTQSKCGNSKENDTFKDIINDTKKLLLYEQIEMLSDEDIEQIKEKSVNRYVKEIQKFENKQSFYPCQKNICKWDDEIFKTQLPRPQNNLNYLKLQKINIDNDCEKAAEIANILNKFNHLTGNETNHEVCKEVIIDSSERNININSEIKCQNLVNNEIQVNTIEVNNDLQEVNNKEEINNDLQENNNNEEIYKTTEDLNCTNVDIPELTVISQKNSKLEFLEVKKITIEDKNTNLNFVEENETCRSKKIIIKTITKWKSFTKKNKTIKNNKYGKINNFIENLQKLQTASVDKLKTDSTDNSHKEITETNLKSKINSYIDSKVSSYEHRFRAQKDIIIMQKQKLNEQNKLIEELKLNKIQKEVKESLEKATNLKNKISYPYKQKAKPKETTVTLNEEEKKDSSLNIYINFSKAPRIVQMMEDRAKKREERRLLIQERKRLIEEEKKRQAEELVERKKKEEVDEKQKRIEKVKKQRDAVRKLELQKQLQKKYYLKMCDMASEHYQKKLKSYGMKYFKMLIYELKIKTEIAKRFYENNIVINCFKEWSNFTKKINNGKNKLAISLYTKILLRNAITCWKSYLHIIIQCKQVAVDRYEMSLQSKCFIAWHNLICEYRIYYSINVKKAENYYKRILLIHCFENWRSLPAIMQIERIQCERKRKWRLRVAEVLSDYDPLKNYIN